MSYHTLEKYHAENRQIQEFETWKTIYGVLKIPSLQILTPQIDWQSRFRLIMVKTFSNKLWFSMDFPPNAIRRN